MVHVKERICSWGTGRRERYEIKLLHHEKLRTHSNYLAKRLPSMSRHIDLT